MNEKSYPSRGERKDDSPRINQRDKITIPLKIKELKWTPKQQKFISDILDKNTKVVFLKGPAGSGKTMLAMYCGLRLLNEHRVSDLILVRPAVESSDTKLGFLPGDLEEKYGVYITPFKDKVEELLSDTQIKYLEKDGRFILRPINYARGLHWAVRFVCADECQNFTLKELRTLATRIGEYTKLILCGDPDQSDLHNGKGQAFLNLYSYFDDKRHQNQGILCLELTEDDIVRSGICAYMVQEFRKFTQEVKND